MRKKVVSDKALVPVTSLELTKVGSSLISMAFYDGAAGQYEIFGINDGMGKPGPLVETEVWRLFVAKTPTGQMGLMKTNRPEVAGSIELLDREARILRTLQTLATEIDDETEEEKDKPHQGAFFPTVLETINAGEEKIAVFLGYHPSITSYKQLMPLPVALKGNQRIDMKSAAWLFGKLMKTVAFVHDCGFTVGMLDAGNVLIEPSVHGVFVLDFVHASEAPTLSEQLEEVGSAARVVWDAVGGPQDDLPWEKPILTAADHIEAMGGEYITDENLPPYDRSIMGKQGHADFADLLIHAMCNDLTATEVHTTAYPLFDKIWPKVPNADGSGLKRQWHNFLTYARK